MKGQAIDSAADVHEQFGFGIAIVFKDKQRARNRVFVRPKVSGL
jgi:hypothetical protein